MIMYNDQRSFIKYEESKIEIVVPNKQIVTLHAR